MSADTLPPPMPRAASADIDTMIADVCAAAEADAERRAARPAELPPTDDAAAMRPPSRRDL